MPDNSSAFKAMLEEDPSGWETEPTEDDYHAFQSWAISLFGKDTYEEYMKGGWNGSPEV